MSDNLKAFYQKLSDDESLAREFKALVDELNKNRINAVLEFAKAHGIELTEADLTKPKDDTLSDGI